MLDSINQQAEEMLNTLLSWCSISSGSFNTEGLKAMARALIEAFSPLTTNWEKIPLNSTGKELLLFRKKRAGVPSILLGGHYDTVFKENSSFKIHLNKNQLIGPGVLDMKGGLVILLYALRCFENSPLSERLGWEVFLNPDEEIGSVHSAPYIEKLAQKHDYGLIFEPSYPDGAYVSRRKGSLSLKITAQGRSAHAGRDFSHGINAIVLLSELLLEIHHWNTKETTINIGTIEGGEAINSVPEFATATLNIRAWEVEEINEIKQKLASLIPKNFKIEELSYRPPKKVDTKLYKELESAVGEEGSIFAARESGGCSDGNNLSFAGLATIDTMGAVGGGMHTSNEYLEIESLVQRARIALRLLIQLAQKGKTP